LWSGLERLFIYADGDVGGDSDLQHVRIPAQDVLVWQLSKHFDLFGLIKAGLAIDKTRLNSSTTDERTASQQISNQGTESLTTNSPEAKEVVDVLNMVIHADVVNKQMSHSIFTEEQQDRIFKLIDKYEKRSHSPSN
jgi:hypothetical protein